MKIKHIQDGVDNRIEEVGLTHTKDYCNGYVAALSHFAGLCTEAVRYAETIGLVDQYCGFHGQGNWQHPNAPDLSFMSIALFVLVCSILLFSLCVVAFIPLSSAIPMPRTSAHNH